MSEKPKGSKLSAIILNLDAIDVLGIALAVILLGVAAWALS